MVELRKEFEQIRANRVEKSDLLHSRTHEVDRLVSPVSIFSFWRTTLGHIINTSDHFNVEYQDQETECHCGGDGGREGTDGDRAT